MPYLPSYDLFLTKQSQLKVNLTSFPQSFASVYTGGSVDLYNTGGAKLLFSKSHVSPKTLDVLQSQVPSQDRGVLS